MTDTTKTTSVTSSITIQRALQRINLQSVYFLLKGWYVSFEKIDKLRCSTNLTQNFGISQAYFRLSHIPTVETSISLISTSNMTFMSQIINSTLLYIKGRIVVNFNDDLKFSQIEEYMGKFLEFTEKFKITVVMSSAAVTQFILSASDLERYAGLTIKLNNMVDNKWKKWIGGHFDPTDSSALKIEYLI